MTPGLKYRQDPTHVREGCALHVQLEYLQVRKADWGRRAKSADRRHRVVQIPGWGNFARAKYGAIPVHHVTGGNSGHFVGIDGAGSGWCGFRPVKQAGFWGFSTAAKRTARQLPQLGGHLEGRFGVVEQLVAEGRACEWLWHVGCQTREMPRGW